MQRTTNKAEQHLNQKQIYRMAVGLFETSHFELQRVCFKELKAVDRDQDIELARVYKKGNQTYILYYPGKDNATADNTPAPLNAIINLADSQLKAQMEEDNFNQAKKIFLINERNSWVSPNHWVLGIMDEQGCLTIEDSADKFYDESNIEKMIQPQSKESTIKQGLHDMFADWQSPYFVMQMIARVIYGQKSSTFERELKTTTRLYAKYYQAGNKAVNHEFSQKMRAEVERKQQKRSQKEAHLKQAKASLLILRKIQTVNLYLKQRAKKSPIDLGLFTVYRGKDYYDRRNSWKRILNTIRTKMNHTAKTIDLSGLALFISQEAFKFKSGVGGGDYYRVLTSLAETVQSMESSFTVDADFIQRIASYHGMYDEMDQYKAACSNLHQTNNVNDSGNVMSHKAAYWSLYANLNKEDQKQFLTMEKEHSAEYRHTFDY